MPGPATWEWCQKLPGVAQVYCRVLEGSSVTMSASPPGRTNSDGAEYVVPGPTTWTWPQEPPGVAQ